MNKTFFERDAQVYFTGVGVEGIKGLRVAFQVGKTSGEGANQATIRVWNLAKGNRMALARTYPRDGIVADPVMTVFLAAGYKGADRINSLFVRPLPLIFGGTVLNVTNTRDGPDWITEITANTGLEQTQRATVEVNFSKPTNPGVILDALLAPLNVEVRKVFPVKAELAAATPVQSFSASGRAFTEARKFSRSYGFEITIDEHGSLLVYKPQTARDPEALPSEQNIYGPGSGLISSPKVTRVGVEARLLLRPEMQLLKKFYLRSKTLDQSVASEFTIGATAYPYIALSINHTGDTRGDPWFTDVTGVYPDLDGVALLTEPGVPSSFSQSQLGG